MIFARTGLHLYEQAARLPHGLRSAVSLHCHTHHSKEALTFIPHYAARIPVVARFFRNEADRYLTLHGRTIDFARAYWTPPVAPREVLEIETLQIESRFGLPALVSITDHDDIEAGLRLQVMDATNRIPISLEWTVPYQAGFFHLGIHNLPAERAAEITQELMKHTEQQADARPLDELFAILNESAETLIVLNHPLWDIEFIGADAHADCLRAFLVEHGVSTHALEINGFRSWRENRAVLRLAEDKGFPVVAGGDRHGCQANTMLNLTRAQSFADYVAEVRDDAHSEVVLMPEYRTPRLARTFEVMADVFRHYPDHSLGRPRWTDRVFIDRLDGGGRCQLSHYWRGGGPRWVRAAVWMMRTLGSRRVQPALRLALADEQVSYES
jgi:hypothetical protein